VTISELYTYFAYIIYKINLSHAHAPEAIADWEAWGYGYQEIKFKRLMVMLQIYRTGKLFMKRFGCFTYGFLFTFIIFISSVSAFSSAIQMKAADPAKVVVGYWHNWDLPQVHSIRLKDVPSYYNVVCVAFVESTSPSDMTMRFSPDSGIESNADFISDVQTLKARGVRVIISLGGQNGTVILTTSAQKQTFMQSMDAIIKKYGFNGLDLDLEGGDVMLESQDTDFKNPVSPRLVNLIDAVKTLRNNNGGSDFWVTAAPEIAYVQGAISAFAGIWGGYLPVLYGLRNELTYVHVQYYNCGGNSAPDGKTYNQGTADFIVAMTDMLISGFYLGNSTTNYFPGFPETQVSFGLPAVASAAPSGGYTALADVVKALDYLTKGKSFGGGYTIRKAGGYPNLRGIMTWSINWDNTNNYNFGKTFSTYFGVSAGVHESLPKNKGTGSLQKMLLKNGVLIINDNAKVSSVEIYTMNGMCVKRENHPGKTIFLSNIPNGMYLVRMNADGQTSTQEVLAK